MKFVLFLLLTSCVPEPPKSLLNEQVQKSIQWLRIAQAYTDGCVTAFKDVSKEQAKKCNVAGTEYANKKFPLSSTMTYSRKVGDTYGI